MRQIEPDKGFFFFFFSSPVCLFVYLSYFAIITFIHLLNVCADFVCAFIRAAPMLFVFVSGVPNGRTPRQKQIMGSH
jgi:hypothetical protein